MGHKLTGDSVTIMTYENIGQPRTPVFADLNENIGQPRTPVVADLNETRPGLWHRITHSIIGRVALGALLVGGVSAGSYEALDGGSPSIAATAAIPANTGTEGLIKELTVNQPDVNCVSIVQQNIQQGGIGKIETIGSNQVVQPHIGALDSTVSQGGDRLWSDSMEGPLLHPNNTASSAIQIEATICEDPLFGATFANQLANTTVAGINLASLNSWLMPYKFDSSQPTNNIETKAASFFNNVSSDTITQTVAENKSYSLLAESEVTLLSRFDNVGRGEEQTIYNYHLSVGDLIAGSIPQVSLNPVQYEADADIFQLTEKTGGCLLDIGFNTKDLRPEAFNQCVIVSGPQTITPSTSSNELTIPPSSSPSNYYIGPKQNPHPPISGGETTTIAPDKPGPSVPTTSTTVPPTTETTISANTTTSSSVPPQGCGKNCK